MRVSVRMNAGPFSSPMKGSAAKVHARQARLRDLDDCLTHLVTPADDKIVVGNALRSDVLAHVAGLHGPALGVELAQGLEGHDHDGAGGVAAFA